MFLHDSAGEVQQTSGPKVLDNAVFFLRLGQKIVHFLTVHTAAGRLYEVERWIRDGRPLQITMPATGRRVALPGRRWPRSSSHGTRSCLH